MTDLDCAQFSIAINKHCKQMTMLWKDAQVQADSRQVKTTSQDKGVQYIDCNELK